MKLILKGQRLSWFLLKRIKKKEIFYNIIGIFSDILLLTNNETNFWQFNCCNSQYEWVCVCNDIFSEFNGVMPNPIPISPASQ